MGFRRFGTGVFGSALARNPSAGFPARLPEQMRVFGSLDKAEAAEVRFVAALRLDQVPQIENAIDPRRSPAEVAEGRLIRKPKRKVEPDQETLTAAELTNQPVRHIRACPSPPAGRRDQFGRAAASS